MTTRSVALPHPYATPAAFLRQYFYFCMSLLIAVVVVYGFSHTIGQNLLHASPIPPFVLTIPRPLFFLVGCFSSFSDRAGAHPQRAPASHTGLVRSRLCDRRAGRRLHDRHRHGPLLLPRRRRRRQPSSSSS